MDLDSPEDYVITHENALVVLTTPEERQNLKKFGKLPGIVDFNISHSNFQIVRRTLVETME